MLDEDGAKLIAYLRRQGEQCNDQQPLVRIAGSELVKAADRIEALELALEEIAAFTNGYGGAAGHACRMARDGLFGRQR